MGYITRNGKYQSYFKGFIMYKSLRKCRFCRVPRPGGGFEGMVCRR